MNWLWLIAISSALGGVNSYVYMRNATKRTVGSLIPWPKEIDFPHGNDFVSLDPYRFKIRLDGDIETCAIVTLASDRYVNNLIFDDVMPEVKDDPLAGKRKHLGSIRYLQVSFDHDTNNDKAQQEFNCESMPSVDMDESYSLTVQESDSQNEINGQGRAFTALLSAKSSWGLLRGLETFSQLVFNLGPGFFGIRPVIIKDEPRFKHRGFMLDTARHYISIDNIIKLIDAMAFNKLNVFHWHMVDDQSFPYESSTYSQLAKRTAFRPGFVYSRQDVLYVIMYAATRGIRVLPELDTPGHTYAMRFIPDLLTECYDTATGEKNGDFGPINPTKIESYKSVSKLIGELSAMFPDEWFHAGGDEVDFDCWKSSPEINNWMHSKNIKPGDYRAVSNHYIKRLYSILNHYNRTMIVWQEVFDDGANLPKDQTIVHVWKDLGNTPKFMAELERVVGSGYRALLSSCWYLNYIDYGQDWLKFYKCDPGASPIKKEQLHLIQGGEICMWTEFVDDTNVISRTWPRASAAAERLWSPSSVTNTTLFLHRLEQMRCRLKYRNIDAEPVNGPGYC